MKSLATAFVILLSLTLSAQAHHRHHSHPHSRAGLYVCGGCVVRDTLAGIVAVSAHNAERIIGTINALVGAGFKGTVHCAAPPGTHVARSLHHSGNACDMAQHGWGKTASPMMYHAGAIIASHGMRDGCSFRDCGHIDMGYALVTRRHYHVRHARHHHRARYASNYRIVTA